MLKFGCHRVPFVAWIVLSRLVLLIVPGTAVADGSAVLDIGSRLELFVDRYLIDRLDGVNLELHAPQSAGMAIKFNHPWEGEFSFGPKIVASGEKYHMYYRGLPAYRKGEKLVEHTCYAVSTDGIHWAKPNLGLVEIEFPARLGLEKTRDNNVLFEGSGFGPFYDTRPGVPASERFKALREPPRNHVDVGVRAYVSGDGVHWKLMRDGVYGGDRLESAWWSEAEHRYVSNTPASTTSVPAA